MSGEISPLWRLAAVNNAAWCVAMWQAHGLEAQRGLGMAMCRGTPPKYYPSAVTIDPNADPAPQAEWAARLLVEGPPGGHAIKDSFERLDLSAHGYGRLISGQWLHRPPQNAPPRPALDWRLVETADDLAAWSEAWSGGNPEDSGVFAPALLGNPGIGVMAGWDGEAIVAGCVLAPTDSLIGLSNVFAAPGIEGQAEAAAIAQAMFPDKGLVGYEHGAALEAALAAGFQTLGPLTVWASWA
ncbi:hypothetical protein ACO2Q3_07390 [Caulobacter sp. KR2-114]|uniref:hypothetical protein n=1 Tax=Caulobacter sp. KR2-114 TaxID=3400912 RepID=UPI003C088646